MNYHQLLSSSPKVLSGTIFHRKIGISQILCGYKYMVMNENYIFGSEQVKLYPDIRL